MYDELVKDLREATGWKNASVHYSLMNEAADAIERLEAALILMVLQYCTDDDGTLYHQFMCAGEGSFDALGITLKTNQQVLWNRLDEIEAKEGKRMIKVTCQLDDYSSPSMPSIKVHTNWNTKRNVDLEVDGKKYTVNGNDIIQAVQNAMNTNSLC